MRCASIRVCLAGFLALSGGLAAHAGTVPSGCHATLTAQDALRIAAAVPNARAFVEERHARLSTELAGRTNGNAVLVRVTANVQDEPAMEIGVYTVNLRSGAVTDDDQEPADDATSRQQELKLLARRCAR